MRPTEKDQIKEKPAINKSPLETSLTDSKFLNMVNAWVKRYSEHMGVNITIGGDVTIDFGRLALFPQNPRGKEFIEYVRTQTLKATPKQHVRKLG